MTAAGTKDGEQKLHSKRRMAGVRDCGLPFHPAGNSRLVDRLIEVTDWYWWLSVIDIPAMSLAILCLVVLTSNCMRTCWLSAAGAIVTMALLHNWLIRVAISIV
ncbi:MAG: hypothetical protein KDA69_01360 [Planctomycetaceae bacterium]|nr:hypothetical protein [Planctomycetaceae bacterium]MCA9042934.1 hypothetical protein [Planctomycetaceae bacterium]MCB9950741.1 hypothetical protein [Planctomycetaceae bacterium]